MSRKKEVNEEEIEKKEAFPVPVIEAIEVRPKELKDRLKAIHDFQALVRHNLKEGHDFGVIPGTEKPTLLKPGAEKIAKLLGLSDDYEILKAIEDWENGFFYYLVQCKLISIQTGQLVSSGVGSCNSKESKYRYRWIPEWKLPEGTKVDELTYEWRIGKSGKKYKVYKVLNDDIFSIVNTILKMAKKRAMVDAVLSAGRLSDLYTQDLEDYIDVEAEEVVEEDEKKARAKEETTAQVEQTRQEPQEELKSQKEIDEKERVINDIKYQLGRQEIDIKDFKKFLEYFQAEKTKAPRQFVGWKFGNPSFHEGNLDDLKLLLENLQLVIEKYKKWKAINEKATV